MKFNSTVMLTLTILVMMLAAGSASAYIGFLMGSQALKGVTQPDISSENGLRNRKQTPGTYKGLKLADEKKILIEVYNQMHEREKLSQPKAAENLINSRVKPKSITNVAFPIRDSDAGVTMEVVKAQHQGNSLMLDINLKNEGKDAVRFLYSFLDVRDDRGRILSAIPERLPGELPANGQSFKGTLKIPTALLDNAQNISLTLTDYPAQKLELKLTDIPVTK